MEEKYAGNKIIPFFMAFPLERYLDNQDEVVKDREYLAELYPMAAKKIRRLIQEELKLRDYKGSIIYDEYPDRVGLMLIANAVYEKTKGVEEIEQGVHVKDLIEVLLYQEILERRHSKKDMFYL